MGTLFWRPGAEGEEKHRDGGGEATGSPDHRGGRRAAPMRQAHRSSAGQTLNAFTDSLRPELG